MQRQMSKVAQQIMPIILAIFINLLDACAFGTCFFPSQLGETSGLAIEIFILSTVIAQGALVCFSSFNFGLGTAMVENIPFIHTIAKSVLSSGSYSSPQQVFDNNNLIGIRFFRFRDI